eukprot:gene5462-7164_t
MDRLEDLQKLAKNASETDEDESQSNEVSVKIEESSSDELFMSEFFDQIKQIMKNISSIDEEINIIAEKHEQVIAEANSQRATEINKELHTHMDTISGIASRVRRDLKAIEQENKRLLKDGAYVFADGTISTELRIRQSQHSTLSRRFVAIMTRYNDVQARNKAKYSEAVRRLCYVCDPDMSEETVQTVIDNGTEGVFSGLRAADAQATLTKIRDRHNDLVDLEKSLMELHEMFTDMALLVESQGEMIDNIEFSVQRAHNYVKSAADNTHQAATYKKKARQVYF